MREGGRERTSWMWSQGMSRAGPQPWPSSGVRVSGGVLGTSVSFGGMPGHSGMQGWAGRLSHLLGTGLAGGGLETVGSEAAARVSAARASAARRAAMPARVQAWAG